MTFDVMIRYSMLGFRSTRHKSSIESLIPEFVDYIRDMYISGIFDTINSQRYRGNFEPLDKSYVEYKKSLGIPDNPIDYRSVIINSMIVIRTKRYSIITIDNRSRIPGSDVQTSRFLRMLEYGLVVPSRPLLVPVKRDIEYNLRYYWDSFMEDRLGVPYAKSY